MNLRCAALRFMRSSRGRFCAPRLLDCPLSTLDAFFGQVLSNGSIAVNGAREPAAGCVRLGQDRASQSGAYKIPITCSAMPLGHKEFVKLVLRSLAVTADRELQGVLRGRTFDSPPSFMGISEREAWKYMKSSGFKNSWTLRGLRRYFKSPTTAPRHQVFSVNDASIK